MQQLLVYSERLTANAEVATVLGSIPASSDTAESEGQKICQYQKTLINKESKVPGYSLYVLLDRYIIVLANTTNTAVG